MQVISEQAFRAADKAARLLGDMKHGLYEVKSHGGISEEQRLNAIKGFMVNARGLVDNVDNLVDKALEVIRAEEAKHGKPGK